MNNRGFSFIEMLIVFILIGIIASFGIPRLRDATYRGNVRSARLAVGGLVSKARALAVQRGCTATVNLTSGTSGSVTISLCNVNGVGTQTLGATDSIAGRYKVTLTPTTTSFRFDPRGLKIGSEAITVRITAGSGSIVDSVYINAVGKVMH